MLTDSLPINTSTNITTKVHHVKLNATRNPAFLLSLVISTSICEIWKEWKKQQLTDLRQRQKLFVKKQKIAQKIDCCYSRGKSSKSNSHMANG